MERKIGMFVDLEPLTWNVACLSSRNATKMDNSVSGSESASRRKTPDRLTESKAFVRSTKMTRSGHGCLIHFSCSYLREIISVVEREV